MNLISAKWVVSKEVYPLRKVFNEAYHTIAVVAKESMVTAADVIRTRGRDNIRKSGFFGDKWVHDFTVTVYPTGDKPSAFAKAYVNHKSALAGIFETGQKVSSGKLMWVPFDTGGRTPSGNRAMQMTVARAWDAYGLEYVPPLGGRTVPLLVRKRKSHKEKMQPVFFGIHSFEMEPKWGIGELTKSQADALPGYYNQILEKVQK